MSAQVLTFARPQGPCTVHIFPSIDSLASATAETIAQIATECIADHGFFTIAFSGGSLPETVSNGLVALQSQGKTHINYEKWHVFFADERCVKLNSTDSNYQTFKKHVIDKHIPINLNNVHCINEQLVDKPTQAANDYEQQLYVVLKGQSFDLVLLGMGPDGHTCSLFPGRQQQLNITDTLMTSITDSPKPPPQRITFTYKLLNAAKHCLFVINSADKAEVVARAVEQTEGELLPSARVVGKDVRFYIDEPTASKIKKAQKQ